MKNRGARLKALTHEYLTAGDYAKKLGCSVITLHRWHAKKTLMPAIITSGGHRIYTKAQVKKGQKLLKLTK